MTNKSTLYVRFKEGEPEIWFDWERGKGVSSPEPHNVDTRHTLGYMNSENLTVRDWEGALREQQEETRSGFHPPPTINPTTRSISLSSEDSTEGEFRQAFDENIGPSRVRY